MTGPARITIELEPPRGRHGRWATRTRVDQSSATDINTSTSVPETPVHVPEAREPVVIPAGYEPPIDCTCLDGYCDADHANE